MGITAVSQGRHAKVGLFSLRCGNAESLLAMVGARMGNAGGFSQTALPQSLQSHSHILVLTCSQMS